MAYMQADNYDNGTVVDVRLHPSEGGYLITIASQMSGAGGDTVIIHADWHVVEQLKRQTTLARPDTQVEGFPFPCAGSEMPVDLLSRVRKGWAGDAA